MDTPSGSNVEGSNGRAPQTWWSRQSDAVKTALIVGLTTLIGAIITGIFALAHAGGGSQTEPPVAESTTHSSGSAATTPQATTSSASGGTVGSTPRSQAASSYSSSSIYWSGPVGIVGEGLDFDIRPPATATSSLSNIYIRTTGPISDPPTPRFFFPCGRSRACRPPRTAIPGQRPIPALTSARCLRACRFASERPRVVSASFTLMPLPQTT